MYRFACSERHLYLLRIIIYDKRVHLMGFGTNKRFVAQVIVIVVVIVVPVARCVLIVAICHSHFRHDFSRFHLFLFLLVFLLSFPTKLISMIGCNICFVTTYTIILQIYVHFFGNESNWSHCSYRLVQFARVECNDRDKQIATQKQKTKQVAGSCGQNENLSSLLYVVFYLTAEDQEIFIVQ